MCTHSCVIATDVAVPFNEVVQLTYSEVFRFGDLTRWLR